MGRALGLAVLAASSLGACSSFDQQGSAAGGTAQTVSHLNATQEGSTKASTSASRAADILSIPSIDLSTGLQPQGLRGGKVNPAAGQAIWYTGNNRVAPGEKGTAVIAGHVANGSKPDVFARLDELKPGTSFDLTMSDGSTMQFRVRRVDVVDKQKLTTDDDVWGANASTARVVLVTCDDELGFRSDGHRKANLVVVGEKI